MAKMTTNLVGVAALLFLGVFTAHAQQSVIQSSTFSAGVGSSNSGGFILQSTLGQPFVGTSTDATHVLQAGFWYQVKQTSPVIANSPPAAPQITDPADGTEVVVGGNPGTPPLDPETPFIARWSAAADPDGDPVAYTWELATTSDFGTVVLLKSVGAATQYETTLGTLAAVLEDAGVTLGSSVDLWHRAVASDGQSVTPGVAARVTFVRGTLVATEDEAGVPAAFELHPNYPNPFNPTTTIAYDLPEAAAVSLVVYDLFGRVVKTLVEQTQPAGQYSVQFEAADLASGTYFYRIEAGAWSQTKQLILLK